MPILQMKDWSSERLGHLSKVTQLLRSKAGTPIPGCLLSPRYLTLASLLPQSSVCPYQLCALVHLGDGVYHTTVEQH